MGGLAPWHWMIFFIVVLVVFGPKNIPKLGSMFGRGMKEFKDAAKGITDGFDNDEDTAAADAARRRREQAAATAADRQPMASAEPPLAGTGTGASAPHNTPPQA